MARLWLFSGQRTLRTIRIGCLSVLASVACEDGHVDHAATRCVTSDVTTCKGSTGCVGLQECQNDGTWSDCKCTSTGSALLGGPCSDDGPCPDGASCLLPTGTEWLGGGPPVGLCVADCTAAAETCSRFANAVCVSASRNGAAQPTRSLCMPRCDLTSGTPGAMACSAVPSSACEPLDEDNAGYCRPFCTFDSDCPSAQCDRTLGVCVAEAAAGALVGFGETCAPATAGCDGVCLKLTATASLCSNRCVFGDYGECGVERANPLAGVCAYAATETRPGNLGYCTPLCNCNDDCSAAGFVCQPFSTMNTRTALGHDGMCVPAFDSAGVAHDGVACGE